MSKVASYWLGILIGLCWTLYIVTVWGMAVQSVESAPILAVFLGGIVIVATVGIERIVAYEPPKSRRSSFKPKTDYDFAFTPPVDYSDPNICPLCEKPKKTCPCNSKSAAVNHYWEYMKCQKKIKKMELYGESHTEAYESYMNEAEQHYNELSDDEKDKAEAALVNIWKMAEE